MLEFNGTQCLCGTVKVGERGDNSEIADKCDRS